MANVPLISSNSTAKCCYSLSPIWKTVVGVVPVIGPCINFHEEVVPVTTAVEAAEFHSLCERTRIASRRAMCRLWISFAAVTISCIEIALIIKAAKLD